MAHLFLNLHHYTDITKMKAGFGNLVEICGEMIEKQVFFQKISKMKDRSGNILEIYGEMIESSGAEWF